MTEELEQGNYVDVNVPKSKWTNANSYLVGKGFQLQGTPITTPEGEQMRLRVNLVHWKPVKALLEEKKISHQYRDMSVISPPPTWNSWPAPAKVAPPNE